MDFEDLKRLRIKLRLLVLRATKDAAAGDIDKVKKAKREFEDFLKKYQALGILSAEEINEIKEAVNLMAELEHYAEEKKQRINEEYEKEQKLAEERIAEIREETLKKLKEELINAVATVLGESNLDTIIKQQEEEIKRLRLEIQDLRKYYQELEEERQRNLILIKQHEVNIEKLEKIIFNEDVKERFKKADPLKSDEYWNSIFTNCMCQLAR